MKLSSILVEVGAATPSVLTEAIGSDGSNALEAVRRAACTEAREVLNNPPPALYHASKVQSMSFLYATRATSAFDDVPFKQGNWVLPSDASIVGGVIIELCKNCWAPAIVYAQSREKEIDGDDKTPPELQAVTVWVPNAQIAAMEAEFFYGTGPASTFEQQWVGPSAASDKLLRKRIGKYIHGRGLGRMPHWLLARTPIDYHVVRKGPLAWLRLRKSKSDVEQLALSKLLEPLELPTERLVNLKHMLDNCAATANVEIQTIFSSGPPMLADATEENAISADTVLVNSVLSSLALLVLKHATLPDYFETDVPEGALDEGTAQEVEDNDVDGGTDNELEETLRVVTSREAAMEVSSLPPAVGHAKNNMLTKALANTTRICDAKRLVSLADPKMALAAIADGFFSVSDAEKVKLFAGKTMLKSGIAKALEAVGPLLNKRQSILAIFKNGDDSIDNIVMYMHNFCESCYSHDDVTRLLLCSWVTPLLVGASALDNHVYELKVHGVERETLALSENARLQTTPQQLELPPELKAAVEALPIVQGKLTAIETTLSKLPQTLQVQVPAQAQAQAEGAPVTATPDSPTTRALKRSISVLQAWQ